jgi:hypothetical protein
MVVKEIGAEHIVHIVTDNGSNYKKACKALGREFTHITWTPCLAHTVNLMLKDIGERAEHEVSSRYASEFQLGCTTMVS